MADYVVIAISPALIMTLVGSLVFFLLAVFYQGEFTGRLHWVMACFVFAAVLIGRIAIEEGRERAAGFAIALAIPVGIASSRFMQIQGTWIDNISFAINWALIGLIWWCAHRLTWDCTVIDDDQDASGEGLLQTAGLDESSDRESSKSDRSFDEAIEGTTTRRPNASWWDRYVERQRRPHAPGVWVVYFSLAALPLFGIGQWFIPATSTPTRRWVFWLLCIYVASGMGLLLTTSFLGLRRYLRQRRIEMPTLMANLWLSMGAVIVVALLGFAALLPRPSAEYAISELPFSVGSPSQKSSRLAPTSQEGTHDRQPGQGTNDKQQRSEESTDQKAGDQSPGKQPGGKMAGEPEGSAAQNGQGKPQSGEGEQSAESQQDSAGQGGKASKSASAESDSKPAGQNSSDSKQAHGEQQSDQGNSTSNENRDPNQSQEQSSDDDRSNSAPTNPESQPSQSVIPEIPPPTAAVEPALSALSEIFKWAFYAVVILAVAFVLWRSRAEVLGAILAFLAALRDFWSGLFAKKGPRSLRSDAEEMHERMAVARFADYADPFASGVSSRYSLAELTRYSFEAFEAWARERGCPRHPDATPHEMARDVGGQQPQIAPEARNLAELYARAAYARGALPEAGADQLRQLWRQMNRSQAPAGQMEAWQ